VDPGSGFLNAYHEWSGRDEIAVGVSYAYPRVGVARDVCAPLLNTLCIRSSREGNESLPDQVKMTTRRVIEAIDHSERPVSRVVADLYPGQGGVLPIEAAFSYQENDMPALSLRTAARPLRGGADEHRSSSPVRER